MARMSRDVTSGSPILPAGIGSNGTMVLCPDHSLLLCLSGRQGASIWIVIGLLGLLASILEFSQALFFFLLFTVLLSAILFQIVVRLLCQRAALRRGHVQDNPRYDWCRGARSGMLIGQ
jgi:hypothetical protein